MDLPIYALAALATVPSRAADENTNATCEDGIDNDGDNFTDCDDFSCSRNPSATVCPGEDTDVTCSDDIDNDGYTDRDDFHCSDNPAVTACPEPAGGLLVMAAMLALGALARRSPSTR